MTTADLSATQAAMGTDISAHKRNNAAVKTWLWVVIAALFCLVLVGGATRLTDSGLSITQWKPIHGVIPPLSAAEWDEEFTLYQRIPEFQQINSHMTVEDFKSIFWWEWAHRFLARAIGLIFALPLLFFWVTGRIERRLRLPLFGILALGGLQGFIGWWMVSSGLSVRTDVSQYRLATHLVMACLIFSSCIWILQGLSLPSLKPSLPQRIRIMAGVLALFALFQIYLGALVAGLDAGFTYNTWPLMDGALIPSDLFIQLPRWINLFENPKTVQFMHRLGAYTLFALALANMLLALFKSERHYQRRAVILFALVSAQAFIGIMTLILQVPLHWGLLHQAGALFVLGTAVANWRWAKKDHTSETVNRFSEVNQEASL